MMRKGTQQGHRHNNHNTTPTQTQTQSNMHEMNISRVKLKDKITLQNSIIIINMKRKELHHIVIHACIHYIPLQPRKKGKREDEKSKIKFKYL